MNSRIACLSVLALGMLDPQRARAAQPHAAVSRSAEALFNQGNAYRLRYLRARTLAEPSSEPRTKPDDELAIESYTAAIRIKPGFAPAYVNRAAVHYERGDFAAAIADCDRAIRIDPALPEAFNNRSLAYHKSNRYAEAKADFDRTIRLEQFYGNAMIVRVLPDAEIVSAAP